ncbi:TolC family protein [Nibrella saemangeumensis]|uniref:TolC family protein n=1 Tax=Nibrella saemangeumensis TaxID=1084526 RepID=UPI0031E53984
MFNKRIHRWLDRVGVPIACLSFAFAACKTPALLTRTENRTLPAYFNNAQDSTNTAKISWRSFFTDPTLVALIDTALKNNQELNITTQELEIARNEVRTRQGEYQPFVGLRGGAGVDKVGRYTLPGATVEATEIKPGKSTPDPLPNLYGGAYATWEIDIWHKLRNAKKAAVNRYLASVEGRNFTVTNLISEIANSYYELLALDNELEIVRQNIEIQTNALRIVRIQKEATRVTELAVRRFEAQVLNTQNLQYGIQQRIVETENRINFLTGRYPQPVARNSQNFNDLVPATMYVGLPSQLLANRPDIRQAEQELEAARLDVKVAKARFYPSLGISANLGYMAFNPAYLLKTPESLIFGLAGDLAGPLINKNAIIATYYSANARQIQAVYNYERTILNAYMEVANQLAKINNLAKSYDVKAKEVQALTQSITISNSLFNSARADYMEVLLTQRDAQESRFDLIETKMQQLNAVVNIYRALGGGWN